MRTTPPADRGGRVLRRTERSGRGRVAWLRWSSASVRRPRLRSTRARVRGDCVCRPKGASEHYVADYVRERAYDWPCISEPPLRSKAVVYYIRAIKCQINDNNRGEIEKVCLWIVLEIYTRSGPGSRSPPACAGFFLRSPDACVLGDRAAPLN